MRAQLIRIQVRWVCFFAGVSAVSFAVRAIFAYFYQ